MIALVKRNFLICGIITLSGIYTPINIRLNYLLGGEDMSVIKHTFKRVYVNGKWISVPITIVVRH